MPELPVVDRPYPGLRPFEVHEDEIFFGREAHTDRLLGILQRERFLAVLGPSGAGKSSLVRAGMLPALVGGWIGDGRAWRLAILRPGDRPLRRLTEALLDEQTLGRELQGGGPVAIGLVEAELRRGPLGLVHLVADAERAPLDSPPWNLLVLVDQFEEIFRYRQAGSAQADEAEAFINLLLACRVPEAARIHVALTMRTDFLGHCVRFLELPAAINRAQYLTPWLNRTELASAIVGPARMFGGDIAPDLVNELINAVAQDFDQLPLLQHALARMWDEHKGSVRVLTLDDLSRLGGIAGALSAHAEKVFATLTSDQQRLAEVLFSAVTLREGAGENVRSVRRPQRMKAIAEVAGCDWRELVPVVEAFSREGVNFLHHPKPLVADGIIDISHEALIRQWERLRSWAVEEAERAGEYRRWRDRSLTRAEGGELLGGADLARAVAWKEGKAQWRPTREWAHRYESEPGTGEFDRALQYVKDSVASEREREAREQAEKDERQDEERRAAEAQGAERARAEQARHIAEAERARAEAERARAEAKARSTRRFRALSAIMAVLLLATLVLGAWALLAQRRLTENQQRLAEKQGQLIAKQARLAQVEADAQRAKAALAQSQTERERKAKEAAELAKKLAEEQTKLKDEALNQLKEQTRLLEEALVAQTALKAIADEEAANARAAAANASAAEKLASERYQQTQEALAKLKLQTELAEKARNDAAEARSVTLQETVPTQVVGLPELANRLRPLRLGASVGPPTAGAGTGSICCFVKDVKTGARYLLSTASVLGRKLGTPILQPGSLDGGQVPDRVALLSRVGGGGSYDSGAIARLDPGVWIALEIPTIGRIKGIEREIKWGDAVRLVGRGSGIVAGRVIRVDANEIVTDIVPKPGDAGGALISHDEELIGLLSGSDGKQSFVLPIVPILKALDIELIRE